MAAFTQEDHANSIVEPQLKNGGSRTPYIRELQNKEGLAESTLITKWNKSKIEAEEEGVQKDIILALFS